MCLFSSDNCVKCNTSNREDDIEKGCPCIYDNVAKIGYAEDDKGDCQICH